MTKKDYIRAAAIVKDRLDNAQDYDAETTREHAALIAGSFVFLFAPDNERFDVDRFLQACGLQDKPAKKGRAK